MSKNRDENQAAENCTWTCGTTHSFNKLFRLDLMPYGDREKSHRVKSLVKKESLLAM